MLYTYLIIGVVVTILARMSYMFVHGEEFTVKNFFNDMGTMAMLVLCWPLVLGAAIWAFCND